MCFRLESAFVGVSLTVCEQVGEHVAHTSKRIHGHRVLFLPLRDRVGWVGKMVVSQGSLSASEM